VVICVYLWTVLKLYGGWNINFNEGYKQ